MDTFTDKNKKARKEHKCYLCGGKIEKGEVYNFQKNINDGEFYELHNHLDCNELAGIIIEKEELDDFCITDYQFRDYLYDYAVDLNIDTKNKDIHKLVKEVISKFKK